MIEREQLWPFSTKEEAALLRGEFLRRAASGFEQAGSWWQAAECWAEQGASDRASVLYTRSGDYGRAARIGLEAGHYHEALLAYQQWELQLTSGNTVDRIQALLGQAACHLLGTAHGLSAPLVQDLSEIAGQQAYRQARKLLAQATGPLFLIARCWEALGDYGGWLGHYSLVQEGYEQALALLEAKEEGARQARICRAYLVQGRARADRLLCQQLEERLAALSEAENVLIMTLLPVEQLTVRRTLIGHTSTIWSVVINSNGQLLISGGSDRTIKVWDLSTGREVYSLTGHTGDVYSVALSLDGRTLISGSGDRTIKVWDLATGQEVSTLTGHTGDVYSVALSPDGQTLVSGSGDMTIKVWNLSTAQEISTLTGHTSDVYRVALGPDGQTVVSGGWDKMIKVWNIQTGRLTHTLSTHTDDITTVALSPDGRTLISGSGDMTIKVWNLSTGQEMSTLTGHTGNISSVTMSADGQTLVSGSWDKTLKLWDLATGELIRTLTDFTGAVLDVAISPNGQTLVSANGNGMIKVWGV